MPFSSTPLFVNPGDQLEIRYPTPSTWDTQVSFQVQIGTGTDTVTVGTRLPDAKPTTFIYTDNQGSTNPNASLPGDYVNTFQRNTFYYSEQILISGIELRVPVRIATSGSGPRGTYPNLSTAGFSINGGAYITQANQTVTTSGSTTSGSTVINGVNTTGLAVGMYISSANITGEILSIVGNQVTLVEPASASGNTTLTAYFTVRDGDLVRLRVRTEDWYTTNSNVQLIVSDEYWAAGNTVTDTWSITTRAQDQLIDTLVTGGTGTTPLGTFSDYIDVPATQFGSYKTYTIPITGIDNDVVLRAVSTGDVQISRDLVNWSQSITGLVINDNLYTRIAIASTYTTKTSGNVRVYAVGGETLIGGYENNTAGTYGSGSFLRTQVLGDTNDDWNVWTEVDRYPTVVGLAPIFTFSDSLPRVDVTTSGSGYTDGLIYTTTNTTNPAATGLTVRVNTLGTSSVATVEIIERGSGYDENDILQINGSVTADFALLKVIQYRKVTVSTTHTLNNAEVGFTYYADLPISGLGTEYLNNAYSSLGSPRIGGSGVSSPPSSVNTSAVNGKTVDINVQITQGGGLIRKNNTGTWGTSLYVENGDVVNFKITASTNYNTTLTSTIRFFGPPNGGILGNPTGGPLNPTFPDVTDTITVKTRQARSAPYPFKAENKFNVARGSLQLVAVPILGLDTSTQANIISSSFGTSAGLSVDGANFFSSVTINPAVNNTLYIRQFASSSYNRITKVQYEVGGIQDTFLVKTETNQYTYSSFAEANSSSEFFLPQWADQFDIVIRGAGGGNGGDDLPNSYGGRGASGNLLVGTLNIPPSVWPDPNTRKIKIYSANNGSNGVSLAQGGAGGAGGWGYAIGGDGGDSSSFEYSGSGGGGGGASAIAIVDPVTDAEILVLAIAGGGGGGGGAGADTVIQKPEQNGNVSGGGILSSISTINLLGSDGQDNTIFGGGGGGGGGGWGVGGATNSLLLDEFGGVIGTTDLDANGGTGGGWFYDPAYFTLATIPSEGVVPIDQTGGGPGVGGLVIIGYPPQDRDPDPFGVIPVLDADVLEVVESEYIQITGFTGTISVSIISNGLSEALRVCTGEGVGCGSWSSAATIRNNDYIQFRLQTGELYNTTYRATIQVGNLTVFWNVATGEPPDLTPTAFFFTDLQDADIAVYVESEPVLISGINQPVRVTGIDNGIRVRIGVDDGLGGVTYGPWENPDPSLAPVTISNNQYLQLRVFTPATYSTDITSQVTVGTVSASWRVSTRAQPDLIPDNFFFLTKTNQPLNTKVYSNYQDIVGVSEPITFTVTGGALVELNGVETGLSSLTLIEFDLVRLYYTTSGSTGESVTFPITAGDATLSWTVTNTGIFGTDPDPFVFNTVVTPNPNEDTNSNTITLSGIGFPTGVNVYGNNGLRISINGGPFQAYTIAAPYPNANNGDTIQVQLTSPSFPGFSVTADIFVGSFTTGYTVFTGIADPEPILGQWYSSLNVVKEVGSDQIKYATKFDGLPVGSVMPVLKQNIGAASDSFGNLTGDVDSRFPGFIYCDGRLLFQTDYPALYSVIGNTYGAATAGRFRIPDFRNKKLVGTGPVDGNSTSSPALAPDFGPAKSSANRSNAVPGSHGGMWFIKKIASPSAQVIPQVNEPPAGLTATDSQFFDIGTIRTSGYTNVSGTVEFLMAGQVSGNVSLKTHKQFEVPFHSHLAISGQPDAGGRGKVFWNGRGGQRQYETVSYSGDTQPRVVTYTTAINLWGFALQDIELSSNSDGIPSTTAGDPNGVWHRNFDTWSLDSGYKGENYNAGDNNYWDNVDYIQNGLEPGSTNYNEINNYINLATSPFSGTAAGGNEFKWVGAVDIPVRTVSVKAFKPQLHRNHSHYLTLGQITGNNVNTIFSSGNTDGVGVATSGIPGGATTSVDVVFTAAELGIQVLPGTFILSQNKQLIPTPSLDPQTNIPLITPYTWVKWLIKAY